jgi:serine/threonine protein kinase
MVTERGQAKVLDFGLAKVMMPDEPTLISTLASMEGTESGLVMGTVQYMSPEQAMGRDVDPRTDLFSLGVVLYEMTTGRLPFVGGTAGETIDRLIHSQPEAIARLNYDVPWELERIIKKCLEKDRDRRYQSARELLVDLKNLKRDSDSGELVDRDMWIAQREAPRTSWITTVAALVGGLVVLAAAWALLSPRGPGQPDVVSSPLKNATFTQLTDQVGEEVFPSLSPDGRAFVYAGRGSHHWEIYFRRVGGQNPISLTKDSPSDNTQPAFSPDGEHIAFRSERDGGGLFVMGATGENVRRVTTVGYNPAWSPD